MKKHFYPIFVVIVMLITFTFSGCDAFYEFLTAIMSYQAAGKWGVSQSLTDSSIYKIAVGENGAVYISSGREPSNWTESQSGTTKNLNFVRTYYDTDSIVACAVGNSGTVLISHDKGLTWEDHSIPAININLYGMDFINTSDTYLNLVVCGDAGTVYKSSNIGGVYTWHQIHTNPAQKFNTIGAIGSDLYIAAGNNGKIVKTVDGGVSWLNLGVSDTSVTLTRLFLGTLVNSYGPGWLTANNGKIYMTTDYGYEWVLKETGTTEDLFDISFRNEMEGIAAGANGTVRYTSDGGYTWHEDPYLSALTTFNVYSISGVDSTTVSALTRSTTFSNSPEGSGTYIYTVSSEPFVAVEQEDNTTPTEFRLQQNYPNPFNPSTIINYSVPENGLVTLSIYDVLGNEISKLINEEKSAGNYHVQFDASNKTSGIYFYQLKAGTYLETKKMILIK